jgi:hypothetical protein
MKIGLIGLRKAGKTTIFNALTQSKAEVTAYASTQLEPNLAVVTVNDTRLDRLTTLYQPKRTVPATIELMDFVGLTEGAMKSGSFSGEFMRLIKTADALALVLRNFTDDLQGESDPRSDLEQLEVELILSDLILTENRLERIEAGYKRGQKSAAIQVEEKTLRQIQEHLSQNQPLRTLTLSAEAEKAIRGFQFLTLKPGMIILNSAENNFGKNQPLIETIQKIYPVIEFAGNFEMELSRFEDPAEAQLFMEDMGIKTSARDRLTRGAYDVLGYISFFTVGADEVRAWNLQRGETALDAAGTIHTDLARGFIRAECFTYNDLIECGSEKIVREKGRFRLEGKDYVVQDGDILTIRFNV